MEEMVVEQEQVDLALVAAVVDILLLELTEIVQ